MAGGWKWTGTDTNWTWERDEPTMNLKPGMRVRVEYESVLKPSSGGGVELSVDYPALRYLPDGTATSTVYPKAKLTPLPDVRTVTIEVTGIGLSQDVAEELVEAAMRPGLSRQSGAFGLTWGVVKTDGQVSELR